MRIVLPAFFSFLILTVPVVGHAVPTRLAEVMQWDMSLPSDQKSWFPFPRSYAGGLAIERADLGSDGVAEVLVAQSGGSDARGRILTTRPDHSVIASWTLFPESARQETDLAVGDLDGDGRAEIVASQPDGANAMITIFHGDGRLADEKTMGMIVPFPESTVGATVAIGDVIGDRRNEIILGSTVGIRPTIRIIDGFGHNLTENFFPFQEGDVMGVNVAVADTDGDGYQEIIAGLRAPEETWMQRFDLRVSRSPLVTTRVWSREFHSGVAIAPMDVDNNGTEELLVTPTEGQRAEIRVLRGDGVVVDHREILEDDFRGGVLVVADTSPAPADAKVLMVPRVQHARGDLSRGEKVIEVDLSDQRMDVWENGFLANTFLISSGLPGTPTPAGDFSVLTKIANHLYRGAGYYFPNTPWNLRFKSGGPERNFYLHTAYWHNNFGKPMSHGCVNMREADAKFLFDWADVGTPVWIHE